MSPFESQIVIPIYVDSGIVDFATREVGRTSADATLLVLAAKGCNLCENNFSRCQICNFGVGKDNMSWCHHILALENGTFPDGILK